MHSHSIYTFMHIILVCQCTDNVLNRVCVHESSVCARHIMSAHKISECLDAAT